MSNKMKVSSKVKFLWLIWLGISIVSLPTAIFLKIVEFFFKAMPKMSTNLA